MDDTNVRTRYQAGLHVHNRLFDTWSFSDPETQIDNSERNAEAGLPEGWQKEDGWTLKYIDDGLSGEVICNTNAICHITQSKEEKYLHAKKSEIYLKITSKNAELIGMKNAKKTKMICVTVAKNSLINSFINVPDNTQLFGSDTLKMLGFVFGRRLNAQAHVDHISKKFFSKLWVLRHLIKADMPKEDLVAVYKQYILPVIEYCSSVYHCLVTEEMSQCLESLQRIALKTIYGRRISYENALKKSGLTCLKARREETFAKFARKLENNPRFSSKWLTENTKNGRTLRTTEKYKIKKSNFDRLKNGPLNQMRKYLNDL